MSFLDDHMHGNPREVAMRTEYMKFAGCFGIMGFFRRIPHVYSIPLLRYRRGGALQTRLPCAGEVADDPIRFLFVSDRPINEPDAWHGSIVMNAEGKLQTAIEE